MPIRNPFRRTPGAGVVDDVANGKDANEVGAKALQIKEPTEYKLSEINDSGVYLPPSPTAEKPSFWHSKSNTSTASSNHRSLLNENEPFNISRESFDSYRRSFDISARSPIPDCLDPRTRQSLDARRSLDTRHSLDTRRSLDVRRSRAPPRSSLQERRPDSAGSRVPEEGAFEDVGLNDEPKQQMQPKKRGIFARFGDSHEADAVKEDKAGHLHFNFTGRKRAQSKGEGSEMKSMSKPSSPQPPAQEAVEAR